MYLIYKLYFSLINNLIIVLFLFRFSENNMHTVFSIKKKNNSFYSCFTVLYCPIIKI